MQILPRDCTSKGQRIRTDCVATFGSHMARYASKDQQVLFLVVLLGLQSTQDFKATSFV